MVLTFGKEHPAIHRITAEDSLMKMLVDKVGEYRHELDENYYLNIIRSIVGQQISNKARDTIWSRILKLDPKISPLTAINLSDESLRKCGLSNRKIEYIKCFSDSVNSKRVDFETFISLTNEEIIQILSSNKGIGQWTAEMFLIFSLGRLDVLSLGDVSLKRSIKWLYGLDTLTNDSLKEIFERFAPYYTVASLYLWAAVDRDMIMQPVAHVLKEG